MTKASTFRCCICGLKFPIETANKSKNKKYCNNCWDKKVKEKLKLTDYIKELALESLDGEEIPEGFWGMIGAQIKLYTDENKDYKYSIGGMLYTLKYMYEYEYDGNCPQFSVEEGLGLLPYYYLKAKIFCIKAHELKQLENENEEIKYIEPETIIINRSDLIAQEQRYQERIRKNQPKEDEIDLSSITEDMFDTSDIDKELKESGIWGDE